MELKMRELRGDDLFPLIHIIGKIDIVDDFIEMFSNRETINMDQFKDLSDVEKKVALDKLLEERGYKVMGRILKKIMLNLMVVKDDLNAFLAELCGVQPTQIEELGLVEKTNLIKAFFKKPELLGFFKSIASFMA